MKKRLLCISFDNWKRVDKNNVIMLDKENDIVNYIHNIMTYCKKIYESKNYR
jgi:hypothetical protein